MDEGNKEQELEDNHSNDVPIEAFQNDGSADIPEQFMMEDEENVTNEVTSKLAEDVNSINQTEIDNQEVYEIHGEDDSESITTNSKDDHMGMKDLLDHLETKCGRARITDG